MAVVPMYRGEYFDYHYCNGLTLIQRKFNVELSTV